MQIDLCTYPVKKKWGSFKQKYMHYTDTEQLLQNKLEIVIYTHGQSGKPDTYFELSSIQNCQYFPPRILTKMLKDPDKYFNKIEELRKLKQEKFFLCVIKQTEWDKIEIVSITDVSDDENQLLQLH